MNGNGLGISELLVLLVVILVFIKPADMPKAVRLIGKVWAKFYLYFSMFKREFRRLENEIGIEDEMKEIRAINAQLKGEVVSLRNSVNIIEKKEIDEMKSNADKSIDQDNKSKEK
ncbi:MAG: hypothetical protein JEZ04_01495 [Spirochaetales bacterium]|nr:hypothetical protein [Spirochaetales bacterium]